MGAQSLGMRRSGKQRRSKQAPRAPAICHLFGWLLAGAGTAVDGSKHVSLNAFVLTCCKGHVKK